MFGFLFDAKGIWKMLCLKLQGRSFDGMECCYDIHDMHHRNECNIGFDRFRNRYFFMTSTFMINESDLIFFNKPIRRRDYVYRDIKRCV